MDQTSNMLESRITSFKSFQDITYFLASSDANCPQKISKEFVQHLRQLLEQEILKGNRDNVAVLVQVVQHLLQQHQADSVQTLVSCGLHQQFALLLGFAFDGTSKDKKPASIESDQLFNSVICIIIEYCKAMNDHCVWLFQHMLHTFIEIISDVTVFHLIRSKTVDLLIAIFGEDDKELITFLRKRIEKDEQYFDSLCERAIQSLSRTGDFRLQESIIELIFRMWPTVIRKRKAAIWLKEHPNFLSKFAVISYDKFDYGVRNFLDEVNSACARRRVLTLHYKAIKVGLQELVPSNRWCNCIDFCYQSRVLDIRFPTQELDDPQKCNWNMNAVKAADLAYFYVTENISSRTIDLHLELKASASEVLDDFSLKDGTVKQLVICFLRVVPLDAQHMIKFTSTLFGKSFSEKHRRAGKISQPMNVLSGNTDTVELSQPVVNSQRTSQLLRGQGQSQERINAMAVSQPLKKISSQARSENQMMSNLALQAINDKNHGRNSTSYHSSAQERPRTLSKSIKSENFKCAMSKSINLDNFKYVSHSRPASVVVHSQESRGYSSNWKDIIPETQIKTINTASLSSVPSISSNAKVLNAYSRTCENTSNAAGMAMSKAKISNLAPNTSAAASVLSTVGLNNFGALSANASNSAVLDTSNALCADMSDAAEDISADLMLQYLHGNEEPCQEILFKTKPSQTVKRPVVSSSPTVCSEVPVLLKGTGSQRSLKDECRIETSSTAKPSKKPTVSSLVAGIEVPSMIKDTSNHGNCQLPPIKNNGAATEALHHQFFGKENVDSNKVGDTYNIVIGDGKARNGGIFRLKKKKRSLISEDLVKPFEDISSDASQKLCLRDPATRSVKKIPLVAKFMKATDSRSNGKRKAARSVLKDLNVDPRSGDSERSRFQTAESFIEKARRASKQMKTSVFPFEELEVPDIETTRDALPTNKLGMTLSPEPFIQTRSKARLVRRSTETPEFCGAATRKRQRVSFESGLPGSQECSLKEKKVGRSRKTRLFDSTSSAADSAASSELSWIAEHKKRELSSPKMLKTYKGKRDTTVKLPSLDKLTREQIWSGSMSGSPSTDSPPEVPISGITNKSITKFQNLTATCNMTFDDIAFAHERVEKPLQVQENYDTSSKVLDTELSLINIGGWDDLEMKDCETRAERIDNDSSKSNTTKGNDVSVEASQFLPDFGRDLANKEKDKVSFDTLSVARLNTHTPVDMEERRVPKDCRVERKIAAFSTLPKISGEKFFRSKKRLELSNIASPEPSTRPQHFMNLRMNASHESFSFSNRLAVLVDNYINQVNNNWDAGRFQRKNHQQDFQQKTSACERRHVRYMKEMKDLQEEAVRFAEEFNSKINKVMKKAASNIIAAKMMLSEHGEKQTEASADQGKAMDALKNEISKMI